MNKTFKSGGLKLKVLNQKEQVPVVAQKIILSKIENSALAIAIKKDLACLLIGETGTGKTSAIRYLALKRKQGYTRINMHGYNTPDELIGTKSVKDGSTYWERGILSKAMQEGHIVVLDEVNATPPDCLFIIHGLLDDDKFVTLPNGDVLKPHKDFRFFATMNPDYEGTRGLNRAFFDRFPIVLAIEILSPTKEKKLLIDRINLEPELARNMVNCAWLNRRAYGEQKTLTLISTRSLLQWGGLIKQGLTRKQAYTISIVGKARNEEKKAFLDFYHAVFKTAAKEEDKIVIQTQKEFQLKVDKATAKIADELSRMKIELEATKKKVNPLKVGDRVRAIGPVDNCAELAGKTGIVKIILTAGHPQRIGVEFDTHFSRGHNLNRNGKLYSKQGHGRWGEEISFRKIRKYRKK